MTKRRLKMSNPPPVIPGASQKGRDKDHASPSNYRAEYPRLRHPARKRVKIRKGGSDLATRVRFGFLCAILVSVVTFPISLLLIVSSGRSPMSLLFGSRMHIWELIFFAILCFFLGAIVAPPGVRKKM